MEKTELGHFILEADLAYGGWVEAGGKGGGEGVVDGVYTAGRAKGEGTANASRSTLFAALTAIQAQQQATSGTLLLARPGLLADLTTKGPSLRPDPQIGAAPSWQGRNRREAEVGEQIRGPAGARGAGVSSSSLDLPYPVNAQVPQANRSECSSTRAWHAMGSTGKKWRAMRLPGLRPVM